MDKTTIGNRIRYERQRAGLTLDELGSRIGVSKQCLSGWEHARNMPDVISLSIIAQLFHLQIEDFLHEPIDERPPIQPTPPMTNALQLTEKETQLVLKLRSLNAERRKAVETLFGIRKKP